MILDHDRNHHPSHHRHFVMMIMADMMIRITMRHNHNHHDHDDELEDDVYDS